MTGWFASTSASGPARSQGDRSEIHDPETVALLEIVIGGIASEHHLIRRLSERSGHLVGLQRIRSTVRSLEERGLIEHIGHEYAMLIRFRRFRATNAGRLALASVADEIHLALLPRPRPLPLLTPQTRGGDGAAAENGEHRP